MQKLKLVETGISLFNATFKPLHKYVCDTQEHNKRSNTHTTLRRPWSVLLHGWFALLRTSFTRIWKFKTCTCRVCLRTTHTLYFAFRHDTIITAELCVLFLHNIYNILEFPLVDYEITNIFEDVLRRRYDFTNNIFVVGN